ncbi:MAG TPA: hypothetical protein VGF99_00650, partial [Myxococcota bacterium]
VEVFEDKVAKIKVDPNLAKLPLDAHDDGHGHGGHGAPMPVDAAGDDGDAPAGPAAPAPVGGAE